MTPTFGYIPKHERTPEQQRVHEAIMAAMPRFQISGTPWFYNKTPDKAFLWDYWKHPSVLAANGGKVFSGMHQLTGSCVGAGGGNTLYSLAAMEVARLNDPELAIMPFWPLTYGKSRELAGMYGQGEGSFGSAFAEAARKFGVLPSNLDGLPSYTDNDGIVYGSSVEMKWSDGRAISQKWLDVSTKHLVKSTAPLRSSDEVRDAILNNYPVSCAGMWGGNMQCQVVGSSIKVLLNRRATTWSHQQSIHGWMNHPEFGELFYWLNQWGLDTHGHCPTGAPAGGYWTKKADVDWQIRNDGELFAFSQFDGFPATQFSWKDVV